MDAAVTAEKTQLRIQIQMRIRAHASEHTRSASADTGIRVCRDSLTTLFTLITQIELAHQRSLLHNMEMLGVENAERQENIPCQSTSIVKDN